MTKGNFKAYAIASLMIISAPIYAEEISPVSVFGSQDETQQAGSAHFISDDEMKEMGYTDAERVLRRIPGVYSQTEDGYGLRTNIGMRGTSALRTTKINVLEDGVPQGPAIYSNGSMYFFPDVGRMEGVEVLKGPAAIGNGPRTTAGTINFLSRSIPTVGAEGHYSATLGVDGFSRNHTYYGGNIGSIGYVFEYHDYRADGYKNIKGTGNNTDAGFDKQTDLFKLSYTPVNSSWNQTFEITSSNTSETSNETYIGLTGADFAADPYQRYALSSIDQMDNDYHRYIFTHTMQPSSNMTITSKLYKTRYSRLWGKSGEMYVDPDGDGGNTNNATVKFSNIDMQGNCAGDTGIELRACNILTNQTAMVANEYIKRSMGHRDYGMTGVQFVVNHDIGNHALEYGYRRHKDYRARNDSGFSQRYTVDANGTMKWLSTLGEDGTQFTDGELKDTDASSWHLKDVIAAGAFTHTLGIRYEDTEKNDGTNGTPGSSKKDIQDSATMMAASTIYNMGGGQTMFVGFSEGHSPVDAGSAATIEPEKSDNYEIGFRKQTNNSYFEVIAFYNDYSQLIDSCLEANGCASADSGSTTNKGSAEVEGIEFQYRLNNMFAAPQMKGMAGHSSVRYPLMISGMLQSSEYTGGETSFSGNSIAYVPDFQLYTSIGMETNNWSIALGAKYQDDTFTNDANTYRTGKAFIFDLHTGMNVAVNSNGIKDARLFLNVDNLFDKVIVASEHEYGKRPNKPLSVMAGVKFDF
ncbi:MAG: Fe(3+) dicitrate transport protein [Gammaproteobacteria bacterium]|jgi:Fe(3+) dicitrate transport protein|tara:strand:- start:2718 stop:4964 length:2247 start_codon:yes stop_codon:yes gene_type:complete